MSLFRLLVLGKRGVRTSSRKIRRLMKKLWLTEAWRLSEAELQAEWESELKAYKEDKRKQSSKLRQRHLEVHSKSVKNARARQQQPEPGGLVISVCSRERRRDDGGKPRKKGSLGSATDQGIPPSPRWRKSVGHLLFEGFGGSRLYAGEPGQIRSDTLPSPNSTNAGPTVLLVQRTRGRTKQSGPSLWLLPIGD